MLSANRVMNEMPSRGTESFKLLQMSDDSKSISDLDLPEIVATRKRKVRRKVRSRSGTRQTNHDDNLPASCKHIGIWLCTSMLFVWLLILSYMTAAVRSDYDKLNNEMKHSREPKSSTLSWPSDMESVSVPLRSGGKKMRKRRELDALVAHSLAKRACSGRKRQAGNGINSQDQLLSQSTDDQEDYSWSKTRISSRHRKHFSLLRTCAPLLFVLIIFILFSIMYWLYFDLRQQLSDYRNQIQQVSAINMNVPETMQKWHENSKAIAENQTEMIKRVDELQRRIENFEKEISNLRDTIQKKEEASNSDNAVNLKDTVASFGAKVESLRVDVEAVKDNVRTIQTGQKDDHVQLMKLQSVVDQNVNSTSSVTSGNGYNQTMQMIRAVSEQCSTDLRNMSGRLDTINDILSQKIKALDDETHDHNVKLDSLSESYANVSSHVTSMESEWPIFKQSNQQLAGLNAELLNVKNHTLYLDAVVKELQTKLTTNADKRVDPMFSTSQNQQIKESSALFKPSVFPHVSAEKEVAASGTQTAQITPAANASNPSAHESKTAPISPM